ncbi:MAG: AfsR/SARP family transcriptional regulator, partial [Longimicrobiales bacterium]
MLSLLTGAGMSRDRLVAFLWPESSEERGRHGLAQLLYGVRRDFGEDVLGGSAITLRLNSAIISSDIEDFDAAHSRGDWTRVGELYRGPFLDGFHLSGCAEFERWVDQERARIASHTQAALAALAERASADHDLAGAVHHWERLSALTPYDSRVMLRLLQA